MTGIMFDLEWVIYPLWALVPLENIQDITFTNNFFIGLLWRLNEEGHELFDTMNYGMVELFLIISSLRKSKNPQWLNYKFRTK